MTLLLIVWLRRYDNSQDLSVDDGNPFKLNQNNYQVNKIISKFSHSFTKIWINFYKKIKNQAFKSYKYVDRINANVDESDKYDGEELNEMKRIRILDQKCWSILKEVLIYIVFMIVLYQVTFSNLSSSSMQYNFLFRNTFVQGQSSSEIGLYDVKLFFCLNFFFLFSLYFCKNTFV